MKKLFICLCLLVLTVYSVSAQCTPDFSITQVGFYPGDSLLPCVEQTYYYDEVLQFKNFSQIDGSIVGIPGFTITIDSVLINSISNLPAGLTYTCHNPGCVYTTGENGCVRVRGTTNSPPGVYNLGFSATLVVHIGTGAPFPFTADSQFLATNGLGYSLTVIAPGSPCPNTAFPGALYVNATINAANYCTGDTLPFHTLVSGGAGSYTYTWNPGTNLSNPNIADPVLYPTNPGTYTIVVSDGNGTTASDEVVVSYGQAPTITLTTDTTICAGETVQLSASGGNSYSWSPATGLSATNIANPVASPTATTTYVVSVSNGSCSKTKSVSVTIDTTTPSASFNVIPNGFNVLFNNTSTPVDGNFLWDFGDGQTSNQRSPNHQYPQLSVYQVTLIASGNCGDADTLVYILDLSVGIDAPSLSNLVSVFPNPGFGAFKVLVSNQLTLDKSRYSILNTQGMEVNSGLLNFSAEAGVLDLKEIASGVYFLKLTGENFVVVKKLIIQ